MKHLISILFIGSALTLTACGKDKKPSTDPASPTAADPAKPADPAAKPGDPAAAAPAGDQAAKPDDKKPAGGW